MTKKITPLLLIFLSSLAFSFAQKTNQTINESEITQKLINSKNFKEYIVFSNEANRLKFRRYDQAKADGKKIPFDEMKRIRQNTKLSSLQKEEALQKIGFAETPQEKEYKKNAQLYLKKTYEEIPVLNQISNDKEKWDRIVGTAVKAIRSKYVQPIR